MSQNNTLWIPKTYKVKKYATSQTLYQTEFKEKVYRTIAGRYYLMNLLGKGSFGKVYAAKDKYTGENLAVKIETKKPKCPPMVKIEYETLVHFNKSPAIGIPKVYDYFENEEERMLVISRLGKSLDTIFEEMNWNFNMKTLTVIAIQTISRLEFIHSKGIIHRDIKPDNFLSGPEGEERIIYLIDFGLSKSYVDRYGKHIPLQSSSQFKGTPRYCSIANHSYLEQSRKSDLESLGYVLIYFAKGGKLPWMGIRAKDKQEKYKQIMAKKMEYKPHLLCANLPSCFYEYMNYVQNMGWSEDPKYDYLKSLFQKEHAKQSQKQSKLE